MSSTDSDAASPAPPPDAPPPDASDARWRPLLARLVDRSAPVVFFPVRHHSPMAAVLARRLVETLRPSAVLVEGPSDYNPHLAELALDHELPIAVYSYFRESNGASRGAYYPFSDYSPEWAVMKAARAAGAETRFIDLPWAEVAAADRVSHRYADAELRKGRYVEALCRRMGVEDFDDLWDALVESHPELDLDDYLVRVHALCFHTRLWEERVSESDRRREAFMADCIRRTRQEASGPILVVTGGFHSSALAARLDGLECPGIEDGPAARSKAEVSKDSSGDSDGRKEVDASAELLEGGIALTTYSYERLDGLAGYDAGMPNPGFYDHVWRSREAGREYSHTPLLAELAAELRKRKQTVGTADLVAVETAAQALAAIRGRKRVWRRDLVDAVSSALVKDELNFGVASPFLDAVHAVLRGKRRGKLAAGVRLPPLVADVRRRMEEAELDLSSKGSIEVSLDLLQPADQTKSRLLHGLTVLSAGGVKRIGGTDFLARRDLKKLWETWRLSWTPDFEGACIEAARYGATLPEAAAARLAEQAEEPPHSAARTAALLVQAAQAGAATVSDALLSRIEALVRREPDFAGAAQTLSHLLYLYCHDEVFASASSPRIGAVLAEAFARALWLLESQGGGGGPAKPRVDGVRALLEAVERAEGRVDLSREEFVAVLERVQRASQKDPLIRGAAAGALWTIGRSDGEAVLESLRLFSDPEQLGDFLTGLFALAREAAQRCPPLVQAIDRLLLEFDAEDFQRTLPSLRLAFTYFTPREKHYMLTTLFESLGLKPQAALADLEVDAESAAAALALEDRIFAALERYRIAWGVSAEAESEGPR